MRFLNWLRRWLEGPYYVERGQKMIQKDMVALKEEMHSSGCPQCMGEEPT